MRKLLGGFIVALLFSLPIQVSASEVGFEECSDPARPIHYMPYCFSADELAVYLATQAETLAPAPLPVAVVTGVEQWRWHVAQFWPVWAVDAALRVMRCESDGDPNAANPQSDARGLFQQRLKYWDGRAAAAGYPGASVYDPWANIAVSYWLWSQTGTWQHWSCKP